MGVGWAGTGGTDGGGLGPEDPLTSNLEPKVPVVGVGDLGSRFHKL